MVVAASVGTGAVVDSAQAAAATEVSILRVKLHCHREVLTRSIGGANAMPLNNRRW